MLNNKSYKSKISAIIKKQNSGNAKILYEKDLIKLKCNMHRKALVMPHPGQEIWSVFLNKQGIWNLMQIKNINISPK